MSRLWVNLQVSPAMEAGLFEGSGHDTLALWMPSFSKVAPSLLEQSQMQERATCDVGNPNCREFEIGDTPPANGWDQFQSMEGT